MAPKFKRQENTRFSKLGHKRKKLHKWRKPKGRDSKMRIRRRGHGPSPLVGYRSSRAISGMIDGKKPILVHNVSDLSKINKDSIVIIAKVGAKKRLEIIAEAEKKNIAVHNMRKTK